VHAIETAERINSVNDRFKNIQHQRDVKLAIVILALFGFLLLIGNRFVYPLLESPNSKFEIMFSIVLMGAIVAQFALISTWTVLSNQSFVSRLQFMAVASFLLLASWALGYISTFSSDVGLNLRNREPFYYVGWIPICLLGISLPLIVLRFFGSRVLAIRDSAAQPERQPVTTASLMITTALIAFVLSSVQLPTLLGNRQVDIWMASGGFAGAFFLIGAVFVLPTVLILFSTKRRFLVWSPILLLLAIACSLGVFYIFAWLSGFRIRGNDPLIAFAVATTSAMMTYLVGILIIRLFGYRLAKATKLVDTKTNAGKI